MILLDLLLEILCRVYNPQMEREKVASQLYLRYENFVIWYVVYVTSAQKVIDLFIFLFFFIFIFCLNSPKYVEILVKYILKSISW